MKRTRSSRLLSVTIVLTAAVAVLSPRPSAASDAFSNFEGRWTGSGSIFTADGSRESIRCRADNTAISGVNSLHLNVNCASDSYRVNIVADIRAQGSGFSGSWQETTRQIQGDVVGTIPQVGQMQASLQTLGGGMQLGATSNGKRQAITMRAQGAEIRGVEITLKRI